MASATEAQNRPKKPLSSYMLFQQDTRKARTGKVTQKEIAELWKGLTEGEREGYKERAKGEREEYERKWAEYVVAFRESHGQDPPTDSELRKMSGKGSGKRNKMNSRDESLMRQVEETDLEAVFANVRRRNAIQKVALTAAGCSEDDNQDLRMFKLVVGFLQNKYQVDSDKTVRKALKKYTEPLGKGKSTKEESE